jgi:acyl carrier protein
MEIQEAVLNLIVKHAGVKKDELYDDALLEDDLGLTGDDAWELMDEIHKNFDVDFSSFEFSLHFGPEAGSYVAEEYGYYPVSVKHLTEVVNEKTWKLPNRNPGNYIRYKKHKRKWFYIKVLFFMFIAAFVFIQGAKSC